ncbi:unnamed protein product [Rotaria sp. Silwood2]|nr:unnamed protein product [Rotaria sp. Silwood2]CAF4191889.1 unnamed protein product [Rotaria sp. Silwood2]
MLLNDDFVVFFLVKNLKYVEVQTKLGELLHSDQSFVVNLTCSNNYNQSIECPNGYCQLIRRGTSNIDRKCIPQGGNINPSGIMIESNTMEGQDAESTFTYACTKQMCNGITTGEEVQTLLMQYGLLPTPDIISPSVQETTTAQTLSKPNTAMAILYKPMMNLQWMLLLIITMFLKI